MKKIFLIAIAAIIFAACIGDKYDAALNKYEDAVILLQKAVKKGDQKSADTQFEQLRNLAQILTELTKKGTEAQKQRFGQISKQLQDVLQGSINNSGDDFDTEEESVATAVKNQGSIVANETAPSTTQAPNP